MPADILEVLRDLHKQATTERSHNYVASAALKAIAEIEHLRQRQRPRTLRDEFAMAALPAFLSNGYTMREASNLAYECAEYMEAERSACQSSKD